MRTLAETLGETWHLSPLARRLRCFGLPNIQSWMQLAVQRGCAHYQSEAESVPEPGQEVVSNTELAVALLLGENPYEPRAVRVAGALLSDCRDPEYLLRLGHQERVSPLIRYIAEKAIQVEPDNPLWRELVDRIPAKSYSEGLLPHRDRFTVPAAAPREMLKGPVSHRWVGMDSK